MNKKGQGLPITTIVIAALALLVLVILFFITTGRLAIFTGAASECPGRCLVDEAQKPVLAQGATSSSVGITLLQKNDLKCDNQFERQLRGSYIAKGTDKDSRPITCNACCASVAT